MHAHDETVAQAVAAVDAALDIKAADPVILDVAEVLGIVELFVVVTTTSDRQLKAVVDSIEKRLQADFDLKPKHSDRNTASGWAVVDFGGLVCHVFTATQRETYRLERLWEDVPRRGLESGELLPPALGERAREIKQA